MEQRELNRMAARDAFTLMEVMIAIAIVAIMAAVAGPNVMRFLRKGNVTSTTSNLSTLKSACMDYYQDMRHFPTKKEGGLDALVEKPSGPGTENWDGPYLAGGELPLDGWGYEFEYHLGEEIENKGKYKSFEIVSRGANGEEGGEGENADLFDGV